MTVYDDRFMFALADCCRYGVQSNNEVTVPVDRFGVPTNVININPTDSFNAPANTHNFTWVKLQKMLHEQTDLWGWKHDVNPRPFELELTSHARSTLTFGYSDDRGITLKLPSSSALSSPMPDDIQFGGELANDWSLLIPHLTISSVLPRIRLNLVSEHYDQAIVNRAVAALHQCQFKHHRNALLSHPLATVRSEVSLAVSASTGSVPLIKCEELTLSIISSRGKTVDLAVVLHEWDGANAGSIVVDRSFACDNILFLARACSKVLVRDRVYTAPTYNASNRDAVFDVSHHDPIQFQDQLIDAGLIEMARNKHPKIAPITDTDVKWIPLVHAYKVSPQSFFQKGVSTSPLPLPSGHI